MAYDLAVGDVLEIGFEGLVFAQKTLNVRHYVVDTLSGTHTAKERFDAWFNAMINVAGVATKMQAAAASQWRLMYIRFQRIKPTRYALYKKLVNGAGTDAGGLKTANIAATITLKTDKATVERQQPARGQIGSWHQPAVATNSMIDGEITNAYGTTLDALGQALIDPLLNTFGDSATPVIFHRQGTNALTWYDVLTTFQTQNTVRTQRTRTVGKGE